MIIRGQFTVIHVKIIINSFDKSHPGAAPSHLNRRRSPLSPKLYIIFFTLFTWQSTVFIKYTTTSEHTEHTEHTEHSEHGEHVNPSTNIRTRGAAHSHLFPLPSSLKPGAAPLAFSKNTRKRSSSLCKKESFCTKSAQNCSTFLPLNKKCIPLRANFENNLFANKKHKKYL